MGFDLALSPLHWIVGTLESTAREFLGTTKRRGEAWAGTAGDGAVGYYIITNCMDDFASTESSRFQGTRSL